MANTVTTGWLNFTAGELSPRLEGRVDVSKYFNGAKRSRNLIHYPHGGVSKRPGSIFVNEVKDSSQPCRLIPFTFSETQAYVLEVGEQYIRFYTNRGTLTGGTGATNLCAYGDFSASTGWTTGTGWSIAAGVATASAGSASALSRTVTVTAGTSYYVSYRVVSRSAGSVTPALGGTSGTARSAVGRYYEFITAGATGTFAFNKDATFAGSVDNVVIKPVGIHEIASPWTAEQASQIKMAQVADIMYLVHPEVAPYKLSRYDHAYWELEAVSFTATPSEWTGTNYPGAVAFFEQRLWLGGTPAQPQKVWGSVSGAYENFTTGVDDDDSVVYTLASGTVNGILWMASHLTLIIGTGGGAFSAGARSVLDPITPTNISVTPDTSMSCNGVQGMLVDNNVLFPCKYGTRMKEFGFSADSESYQGRDLNLLSEHITSAGVTEFCWQEIPEAQLYLVREDGKMAVGPYYPSEEVVGWSEWDLSGVVESVTVIPNSIQKQDDVWVIVNRTINGDVQRYVEVFSNLSWGTSVTNAILLDSALSYSGASTSTLTGLGHLEGETVQVMVNGAAHPDRVVSGGSITLQRAATTAHVGLGYRALLETMRPEVSSNGGYIQGKQKRATRVTLRLYETVGCKVGETEDSLLVVPFRNTTAAMDTALTPFTGDKVVTINGTWNRDGRLVVVQDLPLPFSLLAIFPMIDMGETVS